MSDRTPEQVLEDAAREWVKNDSDERGLREVYVAALHASGWLRSDPADQSVPLADMKALERERDAALANAITPQERELCDATLAYMKGGPLRYSNTDERGEWGAVCRAAHALAASRKPVDVYEVVASSGGWREGGVVRDIKTQCLVFGSWGGGGSAEFHKARCEAECARLNAEGR